MNGRYYSLFRLVLGNEAAQQFSRIRHHHRQFLAPQVVHHKGEEKRRACRTDVVHEWSLSKKIEKNKNVWAVWPINSFYFDYGVCMSMHAELALGSVYFCSFASWNFCESYHDPKDKKNENN